jgi:hypothetical protein
VVRYIAGVDFHASPCADHFTGSNNHRAKRVLPRLKTEPRLFDGHGHEFLVVFHLVVSRRLL